MKDALYWRARWKELTDVHPLPLPANKAVAIFDVLVKEIKQDARHQALTEAAELIKFRRNDLANEILQLRDGKDVK